MVIDYTSQDVEQVLSGYDVVLNSQDPETLAKTLSVLKRGGHLVSISGPPDPAFAKDLGLNALLMLVVRLLSRSVQKRQRV